MSLGSIELGVGPAAALRPLRLRGVVMDVPLLLTIVAVCSLGFVVLYSAVGENPSMIIRQGARFALAMLAFVVVAQISPRAMHPPAESTDRRSTALDHRL